MRRAISAFPLATLLLAVGCSPSPEQVKARLETRLPPGWHTVRVRPALPGGFGPCVDACITEGAETFVFETQWNTARSELIVHVRHPMLKHPMNRELNAIVYSCGVEAKG